MGKNKKYYLNVIFMAVRLGGVFYIHFKRHDLKENLNSKVGAKTFNMDLSTVTYQV